MKKDHNSPGFSLKLKEFSNKMVSIACISPSTKDFVKNSLIIWLRQINCGSQIKNQTYLFNITCCLCTILA